MNPRKNFSCISESTLTYPVSRSLFKSIKICYINSTMIHCFNLFFPHVKITLCLVFRHENYFIKMAA